MGRRGRPRKDERGLSFTIYAPLSVYKYLKEKAKKHGTSISSLIMGYIASGDENIALQLALAYEELKKALKDLEEKAHPVNLARKSAEKSEE